MSELPPSETKSILPTTKKHELLEPKQKPIKVDEFRADKRLARDPNKEHIEILLNGIEAGNLTQFDSNLITKLEAVLKDKEKGYILTQLLKGCDWLAPRLGPKAGGLISAFGTMKIGRMVVENYVKDYLESKLSAETAKAYLDSVFKLDETGWFSWLPDYVKDEIHQKIRDFNAGMTEAAGKHVSTMMAPIITEIASSVGSAAQIPLAIGGYTVGGALTGGTIAVIQESRKGSNFSTVAPIIEQSQAMIAGDQRDNDGNDPRLTLIALFNKSSETNYKFSQREWIQFVSAVRSARSDLLRDMTKAPRISPTPEVKQALDQQRDIVEAVIKGQQSLAGIDRETAIAILSQFEDNLADDVRPAQERIEASKKFLPTSIRYIKTFGRGALQGSGIVTTWRMAKFVGKTTYTIGKKIISPLP